MNQLSVASCLFNIRNVPYPPSFDLSHPPSPPKTISSLTRVTIDITQSLRHVVRCSSDLLDRSICWKPAYHPVELYQVSSARKVEGMLRLLNTDIEFIIFVVHTHFCWQSSRRPRAAARCRPGDSRRRTCLSGDCKGGAYI